MNDVVVVRDLSVTLGRVAVVSGVSFTVRQGGFFVIAGPNASGKSTLLRAVSGVIPPCGGSVEVLGRPVKDWRRREMARAVAVVPQETALDTPFTVEDVVLMGRAPHLGLIERESRKDAARCERAMERAGVLHLRGKAARELSGGERQRVVIARALCQETPVMLLDEPTSALDIAQRVRVMDLLEAIRLEDGKTVVVVSHDLDLAAAYGDQMLLLHRGRAAGLGPPKSVLTEERLGRVYGCPVRVEWGPWGDSPRVSPAAGRFRPRNAARND